MRASSSVMRANWRQRIARNHPTQVHVATGSERRWTIRLEGAQRARSAFGSRLEAIENARKLLRPGDTLIVHDRSGLVDYRWTRPA